MADLKKSKVTLGNVELAAVNGIAWRFTTGVTPYQTVMSVHRSKWNVLRGQKGQPLNLRITDSRGKTLSVNGVYILQEAPSVKPNLVSFVVSDKRWRWRYKLITRDYNMIRKSGDRTTLNPTLPVQAQITEDQYDYLTYSLKPEQQERWSAKDVVEDVLEVLEGAGNESFGYRIESFPIKDTAGGGNTGEFTIQGLTLRDAGDVALSRALSYVPGADVYINKEGQAIVFDATDLTGLRSYWMGLPPDTYAGEKPEWIDRRAIRPKKVIVHYQREVEVLLTFEDNYSGNTTSSPNRNEAYLENVCPTVDPTTTVYEFDPVTSERIEVPDIPPGTWVNFRDLLYAWNEDKPEGSLPWDFDTIKRHWLKGDLEAVLGARGLDLDEEANIAMRVQAIREHFRQTFRINRRYVDNARSIRPIRAGLLNPITGQRAPAAAWTQNCIIPSRKGTYMAARGTEDPSKLKVFRNVDMLQPSEAGEQIVKTTPSPVRVSMVDEDLGIFSLRGIVSPYGTDASFVPCLVVNNQNFTGFSPTRLLRLQDDEPMGLIVVEAGTNGIFLDPTTKAKVLLTMVPNGPNNKNQFHKVEVEAGDVASVFRSSFGITSGTGPDLHVFVPPGEQTARFAHSDDEEAFDTIQDLFGLREEEGIEEEELPGFVLTNKERSLKNHAISVAAELLAPFADNPQGTIATAMPESGNVKIVGNTASATVRVAGANSGKVDVVHSFPGQQRPLSRLAVMPESTRHLVLGIVPFD